VAQPQEIPIPLVGGLDTGTPPSVQHSCLLGDFDEVKSGDRFPDLLGCALAGWFGHVPSPSSRCCRRAETDVKVGVAGWFVNEPPSKKKRTALAGSPPHAWGMSSRGARRGRSRQGWSR